MSERKKNSQISRWILTGICWFCLLRVKRTKVFSQATRRSPITGQHATATGRSDSGISMISICTPPRTDAPRKRCPNKRTPTRAFSSAWTESIKHVIQDENKMHLWKKNIYRFPHVVSNLVTYHKQIAEYFARHFIWRQYDISCHSQCVPGNASWCRLSSRWRCSFLQWSPGSLLTVGREIEKKYFCFCKSLISLFLLYNKHIKKWFNLLHCSHIKHQNNQLLQAKLWGWWRQCFYLSCYIGCSSQCPWWQNDRWVGSPPAPYCRPPPRFSWTQHSLYSARALVLVMNERYQRPINHWP